MVALDSGAMPAATMDEVVALCKRRGLIFPASEIYGGIANTYDYGHYGVLLKRNVTDAWWKAMIQERDDIVALDSAIIQHPKTWEASGHLDGFSDPLVQCLGKCKKRFRLDHLQEAAVERGRGPGAGQVPDLRRRPVRAARVQPDVPDERSAPSRRTASTVYLRPETAQGIFVDFKQTLSYARKKPPFGIAQIGKSFRNEITPGNFIFRTLEFEQMEMEFFVPPERGGAVVRVLVPGAPELVHQSSASTRSTCACARTTPRSCRTTRPAPATSSTCTRSAGPSSRASPTAATSTSRSTRSTRARSSSGKDPQTGKGYLPHVIEPAAGLGRTMLALLCDAYDEDEIGGETAHRAAPAPAMAPVKVAVLPLLNKDGHPEKAREIYETLRKRMQRRVRRRRQHRQALPPPGRDRHAVVRDDRPPDARGRHGHAA